MISPAIVRRFCTQFNNPGFIGNNRFSYIVTFHFRSMATKSDTLFDTPVVMATDVASAYNNRKSMRFLDCSWHLDPSRDGKTEFENGPRLPGASFFDIDEVADKEGQNAALPHMFPPTNLFATVMDQLNISEDDTIVLYATKGCFSAPRGWWTFVTCGHPGGVHVLQGGLPAWEQHRNDLDTKPTIVPPVPKPNEKTRYKVHLKSDMIRTWSEVVNVVSENPSERDVGAIIADARPAVRFNGEVPEPRPGCKGGCMPNSTNLPFNKLVHNDDVNSFHSIEKLKVIFDEANIDIKHKGPIITSCGSGVTASVISLALAMCGRDPSHSPVYDGSWSEWGTRKGSPILSKLSDE